MEKAKIFCSCWELNPRWYGPVYLLPGQVSQWPSLTEIMNLKNHNCLLNFTIFCSLLWNRSTENHIFFSFQIFKWLCLWLCCFFGQLHHLCPPAALVISLITLTILSQLLLESTSLWKLEREGTCYRSIVSQTVGLKGHSYGSHIYQKQLTLFRSTSVVEGLGPSFSY